MLDALRERSEHKFEAVVLHRMEIVPALSIHNSSVGVDKREPPDSEAGDE